MSKLLVYIGENQYFDLKLTIQNILRIPNISNAHEGQFIGAVFECIYTYDDRATIVRISKDLDVVTIEGSGVESMEFAVQFQKVSPTPLNIIDMSYSFNFHLPNFETGSELMMAVNSIE